MHYDPVNPSPSEYNTDLLTYVNESQRPRGPRFSFGGAGVERRATAKPDNHHAGPGTEDPSGIKPTLSYV